MHRFIRGYEFCALVRWMDEAIYQIDNFNAGGGARFCTFLLNTWPHWRVYGILWMSLMCYTFNIISESVYGLHNDKIQANIEGNQKNIILEHFCSKNSGERLIASHFDGFAAISGPRDCGGRGNEANRPRSQFGSGLPKRPPTGHSLTF